MMYVLVDLRQSDYGRQLDGVGQPQPLFVEANFLGPKSGLHATDRTLVQVKGRNGFFCMAIRDDSSALALQTINDDSLPEFIVHVGTMHSPSVLVPALRPLGTTRVAMITLGQMKLRVSGPIRSPR